MKMQLVLQLPEEWGVPFAEVLQTHICKRWASYLLLNPTI